MSLRTNALVPLNQVAPVDGAQQRPQQQVEQRRIANALKSMVKNAATVVLIPWQFAMSDEYYNSIHMDPYTRAKRDEYLAQRATTRTEVTRRNTNYSVGCAVGCKNSVNINYLTYDKFDSDYLICSETCARPVAAHKKCIRESMAATGIGRYDHGCGSCGANIHMTGNFRLKFWEIPYTLMGLLRFLLKHCFFMPMIFCYVWYGVLWLQAWVHYSKGRIEDRPTNPFTLNYVMYSATDPTWKWEADTFRQKWFTGLVFYMLVLPFWWMFLQHVFNFGVKKFRQLMYRYDV